MGLQKNHQHECFWFFQTLNGFFLTISNGHSMWNWILYPKKFIFIPRHVLSRIFSHTFPKNRQQEDFLFLRENLTRTFDAKFNCLSRAVLIYTKTPFLSSDRVPRNLQQDSFCFFSDPHWFWWRIWNRHSIWNSTLHPGQFFVSPGHLFFRIFGDRFPKNPQQEGFWFFSGPKWFFIEILRQPFDSKLNSLSRTVLLYTRTLFVSNIWR